MPQEKKKKKTVAEQTKEFQEAEFPGRVKKVLEDTAKVLDSNPDKFGTTTTKKQRAKAFDARKAAERVAERMGIKVSSDAPSRAAVTKPGKTKTKHEKRREPYEKATGTDKTKKGLKAVRDAAEAAARNR